MLGSQPKSEGEENVHDVLDKKIIQWKKDKEQAFQKQKLQGPICKICLFQPNWTANDPPQPGSFH